MDMVLDPFAESWSQGQGVGEGLGPPTNKEEEERFCGDVPKYRAQINRPRRAAAPDARIRRDRAVRAPTRWC